VGAHPFHLEPARKRRGVGCYDLADVGRKKKRRGTRTSSTIVLPKLCPPKKRGERQAAPFTDVKKTGKGVEQSLSVSQGKVR